MGKKRRRMHRERIAERQRQAAMAQNPSIGIENSVVLETLKKENEANTEEVETVEEEKTAKESTPDVP